MNGPGRLPGGLAEVVASRPLSGGSIASVWWSRLADGREVVVKHGPTSAELEAEGLAALADAGAPVPKVLAHDGGTLVLEYLERERGDRRSLGRALASVHLHLGARFGWHRDNVIGSLPQANPPHEDWPSFLAEARLRPYLGDLPGSLARRLDAAIDDGRLAAVAAHDAAPSLVHGDLWSGNVLHDRWLLDPAVHHADREVDLAMLDLFGSIGADLQAGYDEVWPLDEWWEIRRPLLQLPPLLVHVRLFGASYLSGVAQRLDQLGW